MNEANLLVGQLLKKRRQSLKLSLADVELATKIRGKYLIQLESGDGNLPNDIYVRGFVHNYADYLGLDGKAVVQKYLHERGGEISKPQTHRPALKQSRLVLSPRLVTGLLSLVAAAVVVVYLSWQFQGLASAPKVTLTSPASDQVIYGGVIDLAGHVSDGAEVFVNDAPVLTDANGGFNGQLALQDGLNVLSISAHSKLGKSSTITRNILAHLPSMDNAAGVPADTFDGVVVGVSIKTAATGLVVTIDGKEAFRGTMLAGTSQVFKGLGSIKITTANAGATSLSITNSVAARKLISPLGKNGEVKRDLEFAKTTVIP